MYEPRRKEDRGRDRAAEEGSGDASPTMGAGSSVCWFADRPGAGCADGTWFWSSPGCPGNRKPSRRIRYPGRRNSNSDQRQLRRVQLVELGLCVRWGCCAGPVAVVRELFPRMGAERYDRTCFVASDSAYLHVRQYLRHHLLL